MLFGLLSENQKVLSRLKGAFDPLSVLPAQDSQNNSNPTNLADSSPGNDMMSILGLAELNLNTGKNLQERLLGAKNRPKDVKESAKILEDLSKLQLDTPAEEGLRQVNHIWKSPSLCSQVAIPPPANTKTFPDAFSLFRSIHRLCLFYISRSCMKHWMPLLDVKITALEHLLQ